MDNLGVERFNTLSEEKERLSRELADSCRDYVDLKCNYNILSDKRKILERLLSEKMMKFEEFASLEDARREIQSIIDFELMKSAQIELTLTGEKANENDG